MSITPYVCDKRICERFVRAQSAAPESQTIKQLYEQYCARTAHAIIVGDEHEYFTIVMRDDYARVLTALESRIDASLREDLLISPNVCNSALRSVDSAICPQCAEPMRVMQETSEVICDRCGRIDSLEGVIFREEQALSSDAITKSGGRNRYSNFSRHLKLWLDRLQALEQYECDADVLARIRRSILSECGAAGAQYDWRTLQCDELLRHLKLCHLSRLADHLPKLMKALGARAPPILDYGAIRTITRDFVHIMSIYAQLYPDEGNRPYYPFFIAKILRMRFAECAPARGLLRYIARQEHVTVVKNDQIYAQICKLAPSEYELKYFPEPI